MRRLGALATSFLSATTPLSMGFLRCMQHAYMMDEPISCQMAYFDKFCRTGTYIRKISQYGFTDMMAILASPTPALQRKED